MVCNYHKEKEVVGNCSKCQKDLCKDCFNLTSDHICFECFMAIHDNKKKQLAISIWLGVLAFTGCIIAFILALVGTFDDGPYLQIAAVIWVACCIIPTWNVLFVKYAEDGSRVKVKAQGNIHYIRMVLGFIFKLLVSCVVSIVCPLIYIVKISKRTHDFKGVKNSLKDFEKIEIETSVEIASGILDILGIFF